MMDVGVEPKTQKTHGPADDAICLSISGVLVRLSAIRLSLGKLSVNTLQVL